MAEQVRLKRETGGSAKQKREGRRYVIDSVLGLRVHLGNPRRGKY